MRQSILATLVCVCFIVSTLPAPTSTTATPSHNLTQPTLRNAQCPAQDGADSRFNRGVFPVPRLGDNGADPTLRLIGTGQRIAQARPTSSITQITNSTAGTNASPSISADATRIAFESSSNLTGGNPDGNQEIFLFDTTTRTFT